MGSKAIIFLGLLLAVVLLISSQVAARELDETSNSLDKSNGGYDGKGGYNRGGGKGGGYPGKGGGGYPGKGGGKGKGGGGGGKGKGGGGGGGKCYHGCCGYPKKGSCRCCSYAGEKVDAQTQN